MKTSRVADIGVNRRYWTADAGESTAGRGPALPAGRLQEESKGVQTQGSNDRGRGKNGSPTGEPSGDVTGRTREDWERLEIATRRLRLRWGQNGLIERLQGLAPSLPTPENRQITREAA